MGEMHGVLVNSVHPSSEHARYRGNLLELVAATSNTHPIQPSSVFQILIWTFSVACFSYIFQVPGNHQLFCYSTMDVMALHMMSILVELIMFYCGLGRILIFGVRPIILLFYRVWDQWLGFCHFNIFIELATPYYCEHRCRSLSLYFFVTVRVNIVDSDSSK